MLGSGFNVNHLIAPLGFGQIERPIRSLEKGIHVVVPTYLGHPQADRYPGHRFLGGFN
jgi:hypothetical protein